MNNELTPKSALAKADRDVFPLLNEEVYPELLNQDLIRDAYRAWMADETMTLEAAAEKVGAPAQTVLYWAETGDWIKHRTRAVRVRAQEAALMLELKRLAIRNEIVMDQVDLAVTMSKKIKEDLGKKRLVVVLKDGREVEVDIQPRDMKDYAEAMKAAGDTLGRFLQVAEAKPQAAPGDPEETGKTEGGRPLVVVVKGGGVPQVRMSAQEGADVIDIGEQEE